MQVYNFRPMDVKDYLRPALTTEDRDRLDAADAYYADAGRGYHTFAQICSEPTCSGYWCITISETDPTFRSAIDRAVNGGLCRACQDAAKLAMPSLITYRAKSGSANGGAGGGSRGRSHRNRQSGASGDKRMTKREIERRIDRLNALINAYPNSERVADWQREQEALAYALATYPTRKRRAA